MFIYRKRIFLRDTDATGVIYFSSFFQYALEAFETFLHSKDSELSHIFSKGYLLPIVHAEADYKLPLKVGDELSIELSINSINKRSFCIETKIKKLPEFTLAGSTKLVHAFLIKGELSSSELPESLVDLLKSIDNII